VTAGRGGSVASPLAGRSFRAVWLSVLLSGVGDWAARLALSILVLDRTHSVPLSSLVAAVSFVPWVGPGQYLATRLAHLPRVRLMVGADLARAALYATLLVHVPVTVLLGLVFFAALATPPFEAAHSALTVEVVDGARYGAAITLLDLTDQSAIVIGYLAGGAAVLVGGAHLAVMANVVSFVLSAAVLSRVEGQRDRQPREAVGEQLRRGLRIVWSDRLVRRGLAALLVPALPAAAIEATAAAYARLVLHANANTAGELAAAVPVGILVAVPLLPRSGPARRLIRAAAAVAMVGGLIGGVAFSAGHLGGAVVGYLGAGVLSASGTPAQVAFQPRIGARDRPAVFSLAQGVLMGLQGAGAALGGVLAAAVGPRHADVGWMGLVLVLATVSLLVPAQSAADGPAAARSPLPESGATLPDDGLAG
jgi:hypothetical protein